MQSLTWWFIIFSSFKNIQAIFDDFAYVQDATAAESKHMTDM